MKTKALATFTRTRAAYPAATALLLAVTLPAQATLDVPGTYPQITDAIAAASPGDLIVVQNGAYNPFDLPIGVDILAPDGASVTTPPGGGGLPWVHFLNPPAGQQASITGLTFVTNPAYPPAEPPITLSITGNVVFADCKFRNYSDYQSDTMICNGDVQFDRCEWNSVWHCMKVTGGRVVANVCKFRPIRVNWAGDDVVCIDAGAGQIDLNFCDLIGSASIDLSNAIGSPAIRIGAFARLNIADSVVIGGQSTTWASTAIVNNTNVAVQHTRSQIRGGYGTLSWYPPVAGNGPAFSGPEATAYRIGGGGGAAPRIGANYYGSVVGPAGRLVAMVLSFERSPALTVPFAVEPIHFDPANASILQVLLTNEFSPWPGAGFGTWQTGNLTPAMFGREFWLHPLLLDGGTFRVGPTFGGLVY